MNNEPMKSSGIVKKVIIGALIVVLLCGLSAGGYYYYTECMSTSDGFEPMDDDDDDGYRPTKRKSSSEAEERPGWLNHKEEQPAESYGVTEETVEMPAEGDAQYVTLNEDSRWEPMDSYFSGEMLIPYFLNRQERNGNGGYTYTGANTARITSSIERTDYSPAEFIKKKTQNMTVSYSPSKNDWAVASGYVGNHIFYMKAVKRDDMMYYAIFAVPKDDLGNAKVYQNLTERIFRDSPFPLLSEPAK